MSSADNTGHPPELSVVRGEFEIVEVERPRVQLQDMVGQATVKRRLTELVELLSNNPTATDDWHGGTLLYGPARSGKHFGAQIVAGESNGELVRIDFPQISDRNFLSTVSETLAKPAERRVVSLEDIDHKNATSGEAGPVVEQVVQLIENSCKNTPTLVLGSAMYPWLANTQLVRPGRLSSVLLLLPPDSPARQKHIVELCGVDIKQVSDDDLDWVVNRTDGFSFGDIDDLVERCHEIANKADNTSHGWFPDRSTWRAARAQVAPQSSQWLSTAGHHAFAGTLDGLYDDLLQFLKRREKH